MEKSGDIKNALLEYYSAKQDSGSSFEITDFAQLNAGRQHEMFSFTMVESEGRTLRSRPSILRMYDGKQSQEDAEYEYTIMKRVGSAGVPVPEVYLLERNPRFLDRPFIVMERLSGTTFANAGLSKIDSDPAWIYSGEAGRWIDDFAALLVSIHRVDWKALDLTFLRKNRWELTADAPFLKKLGSYKIPSLGKLLERMTAWINRATRDALKGRPVLLHYDYHFDNVMMSNGKVGAALDWCEACIGEAVFDVAWTNLILHTSGVESLIDPFVLAYKHHSGSKLENLSLYEGLAGLRQLSDILILKEVGAESLNKRADAAALYDIQQEMAKTIEFMGPRVNIDFDLLSPLDGR